jgi:hypothetical protein
MTASLFSSELLARLRRSMLVSGVLFLSTFAGMCGDDDDDDDGGTGPSADCIDDFDFDGLPFSENDVETIGVGGNESGSITENDVEDGGYFADIYILGVDDEEVTITANPSGFDLVLLLFDENFDEPINGADSEDPDATEELTDDLDGCYVIVVTSYDAGETGSYSLSVDN